jgi:hypothetical protein
MPTMNWVTIAEVSLPDPMIVQPEPMNQDKNPHTQFTERTQAPIWLPKKLHTPYMLSPMPKLTLAWATLTANLTLHQVDLIKDAAKGSICTIIIFGAGGKFFHMNLTIGRIIQNFFDKLKAD